MIKTIRNIFIFLFFSENISECLESWKVLLFPTPKNCQHIWTWTVYIYWLLLIIFLEFLGALLGTVLPAVLPVLIDEFRSSAPSVSAEDESELILYNTFFDLTPWFSPRHGYTLSLKTSNVKDVDKIELIGRSRGGRTILHHLLFLQHFKF